MERNAIKTSYIFLCAFLFLAVSCSDNKTSIPFPEEMEHPLPVTKVLHFTEPINLSWPGGRPVQPVVKKFDFNKLPSRPFDTSGFVPFSKPPEEHPFDFDKLPDTVFNYDHLPTMSLKFEVSVLEPPRLIKTSLHIRSNSPDPVYELGEPLVNNAVKALLKDRNGFLWVASNQGLYRYDGETLLMYLPGAITDQAMSMIEDNKDQIWISTDDDGIYIINPQAGILKHLTVNGGLATTDVAKMILDKQGRIWAIGGAKNERNSAVNIIDEKLNTVKRFRTPGLSNFVAGDVMQDNLGNIWITTLFGGGGVNIIDFKNGKIKYLHKKSGLMSDSTTVMLQDAENRIWIADLSGKLNVIDPGKRTITYYGPAQGLNRNAVYQLLIDDHQNIWLATTPFFWSNAHGVEIINPEKKLSKILNAETGAVGNNSINALVEDNRRQIWIGSDKGLTMINRDGSIIERMGSRAVTSLAQDQQGRIWVGLSGFNQGIEIIDSDTKSIRRLTTAHGLCNNTINNIRLTDGKISIMSAGGIDILDSNFTTITHLGKQQGLTFQSANTFSKDSRGMFWISNLSASNEFSIIQGIDVYNPEKKIIQHLGVEQGLKDSVVFDIIEDRQGNIWFTDFSGSAGVIDAAYKTIKYIKVVPDVNETQAHPMLADSRGNIWIGTSKGIYVVNSLTDSITSITIREGLINDYIISLNQYKDHIYAGTLGGLTIITPPFLSPEKKWAFESFGSEHGFRKVLGTVQSDIITRDGRFLWGDAGITALSDDKRFMPSPETAITGINVFNHSLFFSDKPWKSLNEKDTLREHALDTFYVKDQQPSNIVSFKRNNIQFDSVSGFYNMPVNLSLPYYENFLQFHFTQVHGENLDTTWYRYILEGADKNWSDRTLILESKNYYTLAPGSYTFKVTSLYNGKWTKPAEFSFFILPPWWRTWWAYCLFALILFTIVYVAVQYRSRKLIAANLALEEKINQGTAELKQSLQIRFENELKVQKLENEKAKAELKHQASELEMQALRAQMNPHFIFNSLNAIDHFILQNDKAQASKYLSKFSKLIRKTLENSREDAVSICSELELLELYIQLEQLRFNHKFDYHISVDEKIDTENTEIPPLLIQPYIENAILHGLVNKNGKGDLWFSIVKNNGSLICKIEDNGIGRARSEEIEQKKVEKHKSLGIKVTNERISTLSALLDSNLEVVIEDLFDTKHAEGTSQPAGTRVTITIPVKEEEEE